MNNWVGASYDGSSICERRVKMLQPTLRALRTNVPKLCALLLFLLICQLFPPQPCLARPLWGARDFVRDSIGDLLPELRAGRLEKVPKIFFGNLYDPRLADIVLFVDQSNNIKISLVKGGDSHTELFGQDNVWLMVFLEADSLKAVTLRQSDTLGISHKVTLKKGSENGEAVDDTLSLKQKRIVERSLEVRLECLAYRPGAGEVGFISAMKAVAAAIFGAAPAVTAGPKGLADTTFDIRLTEIETRQGISPTKLLIGMAKLPLVENAVHRIRVKPFESKSVYATFGNYSASRLAASLSLITIYKNSDEKEWSDRLDPGVFIFAHFYFMRPNLPKVYRTDSRYKGKMSFSAVIGVELSETRFLKNISAGIGVGHLLGGAGLVGGINFAERTRLADSTHFYVIEPFLGVSYML